MKKNLFIAAMSLLVLAGCSSNEDEIDNIIANNDNAITFDTYVGKVTKAGTAYPTGGEFGVYAYETTNEWSATDENTSNGATPNFMLNTKVTKTAESKYTYSPIKYWTGNKITFIAYHPYADGTKVNVSSYTTGSKGLPSITVSVPENADLDFMISDKLINKNEEPVSFTFKHALSKLTFKVENNIPESEIGKTTIEITSIKIKMGKIGTVNLSDPSKWTLTDEPADYTVNTSDAFYVIPQSILTGSITYKVTTTDDTIAGGKVEFTKTDIPLTLTKESVSNWETNKQYNYTLNVALNEVTVSATVNDSWTGVIIP